MSADVIDLAARRNAQPARLPFTYESEALAYAAQQLAEMRQLVAAQLLVAAEELDRPLAELAAIVARSLELRTPGPTGIVR